MTRYFMAFMLAAALLFGAAGVPATAGDAVEVGGSYNVHGTNPNGSQYTGTVVIVPKDGGYRFSWLIADGTTYKGKGTRKGDTIVVNWGAKYPVIYEVGADGVLNGRWHNGKASETLIPAK